MDSSGMGIQPTEAGESAGEKEAAEEKINPEKLLALKRELAETKKARTQLMENYRRSQNDTVLTGYNAVNNHYHELAKQVKQIEEQFKNDGWLLNREGKDRKSVV